MNMCCDCDEDAQDGVAVYGREWGWGCCAIESERMAAVKEIDLLFNDSRKPKDLLQGIPVKRAKSKKFDQKNEVN